MTADPPPGSTPGTEEPLPPSLFDDHDDHDDSDERYDRVDGGLLRGHDLDHDTAGRGRGLGHLPDFRLSPNGIEDDGAHPSILVQDACRRPAAGRTA